MLTRAGVGLRIKIRTAFRKARHCMMASEKKITTIMDFLVNEMDYNSSTIAETPVIFNNSLKERIILMTDKSFWNKLVKPYEQEAPALMKVS
ncbi:hypothetical protein C5167_016590 [Papaver somniferum]|nr:hypothetical protein C5167_016590 [Papaver somniferum]